MSEKQIHFLNLLNEGKRIVYFKYRLFLEKKIIDIRNIQTLLALKKRGYIKKVGKKYLITDKGEKICLQERDKH